MGKGQDACGESATGMSMLNLDADAQRPADYETQSKNKGPSWLHEAIFMYVEDGLSLREVSDNVGASKTTVRRWLQTRGVRMRSPAPIKPVHRSLDIPLEKRSEAEGILDRALSDIQEHFRALGVSEGAILDGLKSYGQKRINSGAHYSVYTSNPQFLTEDFAQSFSEGLLDRHIGDGAIVSMFAFERLFAEALNAAGCKGELSVNTNHPGRDLSYTLYGETWRSSCKSEAHKKVAEDNDSLQISYLMTWEPPPESAGQKMAHHIEDYDYIHHLRAVQNTTFPEGSSNAGQLACRYNFYQVPKYILEDITKHKLNEGTNTVSIKSRRHLGERFDVKVELTGEGKVRIPSIPLTEVELLASFWISPPDR